MSWFRHVFMGLALGVSLSCSFVPAEPEPPIPPLPERLASIGPDRAQWWHVFDDPVLDRLVDLALEQNLSVAESLAAVREARADAVLAGADRWPQVSASFSGSRQEQPRNAGLGGQFAGPAGQGPDRFEFETWGSQVAVSWEADLWGRLDARAEAAARRLEASRWELVGTRQMVVADTVARYHELRTVEARLMLQRDAVELAMERLSQTRNRYRRGLASAFELYSVRQQLRDAETEIPRLEARRQNLLSALAVLVGRYADDMPSLVDQRQGELPIIETLPETLPAHLVLSRPDLRSALARMEAARQEAGVAAAARLPALTLDLTTGLEGPEADSAFDPDQWFLSLVGALGAPVFQGGALEAREDAARARLDQASLRFARGVVGAAAEVHRAMARLEDARKRVRLLELELEGARGSLETQQGRYLSGVGAYLDFLEAGRNLLATRIALATARGDQAGALVDLHRAVGGNWIQTDEGST